MHRGGGSRNAAAACNHRRQQCGHAPNGGFPPLFDVWRLCVDNHRTVCRFTVKAGVNVCDTVLCRTHTHRRPPSCRCHVAHTHTVTGVSCCWCRYRLCVHRRPRQLSWNGCVGSVRWSTRCRLTFYFFLVGLQVNSCPSVKTPVVELTDLCDPVTLAHVLADMSVSCSVSPHFSAAFCFTWFLFFPSLPAPLHFSTQQL